MLKEKFCCAAAAGSSQGSQKAPRGRSGYSWCISRCEALLSSVLSSPTLVVMLLSLFHLEREPWANTPQHSHVMLCCFSWFIFTDQFITTSLLLQSPKLPLASGHIKGLSAQTFLMEAHLHVHPFRKTEENDSRFPSWRKRGVGIIKMQYAAPCLQVHLTVELWSGSQAQAAAFT